MSGDESKVIDLVKRSADGALKRRAKTGQPKWARVYAEGHSRAGQPISCLENTQVLIEHYGATAAFNLMTHREEFDAGASLDNVAAERRGNAARAQFRMWARQHGLSSSKPLDDHLEVLVSTRSFHPVADWIRSKPWDGVDRIAPLFKSLTLEAEFAAAHGAHALRVLRAWLVTGAMAALLPASAREGIAAQGVLVLQGSQGTGKTRWIMSLVPHGLGWAQESVLIDPSSRDSKEAATKCWLSELGEIDATFRKADIAALKGFLTQRTDTYRKAYDRAPEDIARRTFFAASVNEHNFLADETGSRRFWTLPIVATNPAHGIDLQQLWAQAAALGEVEPDCVWLTNDESAALKTANAQFEAVDPIWESLARAYEATDDDRWSSLDEIKKGIDSTRSWSVADGRHLARVLKNRMGARTRISRGYTQYAVIRWSSVAEAPP
jgi:putative DNA primase/helicase